MMAYRLRCIVALALTLSACASAPPCPVIVTAAAATAVDACTRAYDAAQTEEQVGKIDAVCLPLADAHEALEAGGAELVCSVGEQVAK